jgi:hypothetical protein
VNHRSRAVVVLLAAVLGMSGVMTAAPVSAATSSPKPLTFANPHRVAPKHGGPTAISCPTASFCAMVDQSGNAFVRRHGKWSRAKRLELDQVRAVSCASPRFCMAVSDSDAFRYNGKTWTRTAAIRAPASVDTGVTLSGVSCPTVGTCIAVGFREVSYFRHGHWRGSHKLDDRKGLDFGTLSCPTKRFCMVGDAAGRVMRFDGKTWTKPVKVLTSVPAHSDPEVNALSCATSSFCVAGGTTQASVWNGRRWGAQQSAEPGTNGGFFTLSCLPDHTCSAVTINGQDRYDNGEWSGPTSPADEFSQVVAIACHSDNNCRGFDSNGVAVSGTESVSHLHRSVDRRSALTDISCTSMSFCMVVDNTGHAEAYNGRAWSRWRRIAPVGLTSVSCSSAHFCLATDGHGRVTQYDGNAWSTLQRVTPPAEGNGAVHALSCVSRSFCVLIGDLDAFRFVNGTWHEDARVGSGQGPNAVSCASRHFCAAVDIGGFAFTYHRGHWSVPKQVDRASASSGFGLTDVSCPTSHYCLAGDGDAHDNGHVLRYNGTRWLHRRVVRQGSTLQSVSCGAAGFCLAIDGFAGFSVIGKRIKFDDTKPGRLTGPNPQLTASCPSSRFCAVLDGNSAVWFGRRSN